MNWLVCFHGIFRKGVEETAIDSIQVQSSELTSLQMLFCCILRTYRQLELWSWLRKDSKVFGVFACDRIRWPMRGGGSDQINGVCMLRLGVLVCVVFPPKFSAETSKKLLLFPHCF